MSLLVKTVILEKDITSSQNFVPIVFSFLLVMFQRLSESLNSLFCNELLFLHLGFAEFVQQDPTEQTLLDFISLI